MDLALDDLQPATLAYGIGKAGFAANRRELTNGRWSGFGVQPDGPVDHSVPVLRINAPGGALRGVVFNYACHCTTVGGNYYQINADWAGYAMGQLEANHAGAIALCTIGCGADANPNPRGTVEMSQMHGQELATEVERVLGETLKPIDANPDARFDYAALSFDLPTREELETRLGESNPQTRRHAQRMLKVYEEKGRLPATYPVPIQSWKFGDQLTMVFLGGEVVVDYAFRLKKAFDDPNLWVTAYSNDVLGYIASERMRTEGGYEYDRSGIYYSLPGPWASGSEDLFVRRIVDLVKEQGRAKPKSADASLRAIKVDSQYKIELVASEPLVEDPVNLAFGDDGRLWVVEMGDYPEGIGSPKGTGGGKIKLLSDRDGDGTYDNASTFLDGLAFPTGVQPWKDGVLISAAPEILFARDTDGDDRADEIRPLYSGFRLANPQHRINGFTYGLDHSLHLASGDNLSKIQSVTTGDEVDASGHDVQVWPDSGRLATTSGRTQFIRSRDSFGRWFGNSNSYPMFHFPVDDRYLKRNAAVSYSSGSQQLFTPAVAPPVFPLTSAAERFNDLFAANRFTSACSSIVARSHHFAQDSGLTAFVCEPVHNLVHRAALVPEGASFRAERLEQESESEFLASTDPWFRPVRARIGPDGMLYIVDMYREVIEHPEWIPEAWQERLNVRSGERLGRIYRISPAEAPSAATVSLVDRSNQELINQLRSPIGPLRDQSQRLLIHRGVDELEDQLSAMAVNDGSPFGRLHAVSILAATNNLSEETLAKSLSDSNPGVLLAAVRLSESRVANSPVLLRELIWLAKHDDISVALQVALALGESESKHAGEALARIAIRPDLDRWLANAVISSSTNHSSSIVKAILTEVAKSPDSLSDERAYLLEQAIATAFKSSASMGDLVAQAFESPNRAVELDLRIAECFVEGARKVRADQTAFAKELSTVYDKAKSIVPDSSCDDSIRCRAISLVGLNLSENEDTTELLFELLTPATPVRVQLEAINALTRSRDSGVTSTLLDRWSSYSIAVRNHLVSQLLSRRQSTELLLQSLEAGVIKVNEISLAARSQLLKSGTRSMRVKAARLINNGGSTERSVVVRNYLAKFTSGANQSESQRQEERKKGESLFKKHCGACHVPDSKGVAIGASLDNLTNRTDEALVESILNPNKAVEPKYQSFVVQTDEGQTLTGVIESEVAGSLTLAHADGKRTTIQRDRIEAMKGTGTSLMPEGFETTLSPDALQAIVRYLQR